ncbi:hypothetical protein [Nostoc commune]|nr:hypothetical protein [Nostoc commune]
MNSYALILWFDNGLIVDEKRSPYRKPQKLSDRLLWKSKCDRLAENLKN